MRVSLRWWRWWRRRSGEEVEVLVLAPWCGAGLVHSCEIFLDALLYLLECVVEGEGVERFGLVVVVVLLLVLVIAHPGVEVCSALFVFGDAQLSLWFRRRSSWVLFSHVACKEAHAVVRCASLHSFFLVNPIPLLLSFLFCATSGSFIPCPLTPKPLPSCQPIAFSILAPTLSLPIGTAMPFPTCHID